ncbi:MAG: leucyl aminopeptidase [Candidatus Babeliales bacterium]
MVTINASSKKLFEIDAEAYAYTLLEGFAFSKQLKEISTQFFPDLEKLMKKSGFTGKKEDILIVPLVLNDKIAHCFFVGIGAKEDREITMEHYRRILGQLVKQVVKHHCRTLALQLPSNTFFSLTTEELADQTTSILMMATYQFTDYITDKERKKVKLDEIVLRSEEKNKKAVGEGIKIGQIVGTAVNKARHLIDLPPSMVTPQYFAEKAKEVAKKYGLKVTIFEKKQIEEFGMGGLLAVAQGSDIGPRLVILEYQPKKKTAPTLAFVGKGVTFDSGGLSLKTPIHMETMKEDMSGAAAVFASMQALAQLKPSVHVVGIMPLAENLPDSKSVKPGDIVQFYNGKTAEIKNTDAEGRLILADALAYAVKQYKPDAIIDIATLTGACAYSLGPFYSGLFSQHDDLVNQISQAASYSGDKVWRLPMGEDYKKAIQSSVADICNIGSKKIMAGATTAAHFLQHFVADVPWVHLDIAGTAFNVPDISYYREGATGVGVRLLIELAMHWQ